MLCISTALLKMHVSTARLRSSGSVVGVVGVLLLGKVAGRRKEKLGDDDEGCKGHAPLSGSGVDGASIVKTWFDRRNLLIAARLVG